LLSFVLGYLIEKQVIPIYLPTAKIASGITTNQFIFIVGFIVKLGGRRGQIWAILF
jgi:hypothetical protein